jgi:hypothetical protein
VKKALFLFFLALAVNTSAMASSAQCQAILDLIPKLSVKGQRGNLDEFMRIQRKWLARARRDAEAPSLLELLQVMIKVDPADEGFVPTVENTLNHIAESADPGVPRGFSNEFMREKTYSAVLEYVASATAKNPHSKMATTFRMGLGMSADTPLLRKFLALKALHEPYYSIAGDQPWLFAFYENHFGSHSITSSEEFALIKSYLNRDTRESASRQSELLFLHLIKHQGLSSPQLAELLDHAHHLKNYHFVLSILRQLDESQLRVPVLVESLEALATSSDTSVRDFARGKLLVSSHAPSVDALIASLQNSNKPGRYRSELENLSKATRLSDEQIEDLLIWYVQTIRGQNSPQKFTLLQWDEFAWAERIPEPYLEAILNIVHERFHPDRGLDLGFAPVAFHIGHALGDSGLRYRALHKLHEAQITGEAAQLFFTSFREPWSLDEVSREMFWTLGLNALRSADDPHHVEKITSHMITFWPPELLGREQRLRLHEAFAAHPMRAADTNNMEPYLKQTYPVDAP